MTQAAKFIDVTRTYIPVDPNAFPLSLHGASKEDAPEERIPVMAYKGYNFLPTAYGYKSYFGNAQDIGIDALNARVDAVFIYQNQGYENILIALTDTGVWTKRGSTSGAWINDVAMDADMDPTVHFEWTYVIIANTLYAYRQGHPSYQQFVHSSLTQLTITSVVPNFLNMSAQVGIFKAAGRLAFWDSSDSIGWCNADDFSDFIPSLETQAGNTVFSDVQGRIVTILPHGPGFIIYATKSIIFVAENSSDLYQWNPSVVSPNCGIAYPRQAAIASPDTLHFAYTTEGLFKIQNAKYEGIVAEVTDYLQDYTHPVYLKVLGGRYLFLEILDAKYITGLIQVTTEVVPEVTYHFPGSDIELEDWEIPGSDAQCITLAGLDDGSFKDTLPPAPVDQHPTNKSMQPQWICYLSNNGVKDASNITWTAGPCPTVDPNGVEANMCPSGPTVSKMTQDSSNKRAVTGAEAYVDGKWTMERFVQTQTAIWKAEEQALSSYLSKISNRSKSVVKHSPTASCASVPVARNECTMGRYVSEFSAPRFGYSKCAFWLTRMAIAAVDLVRVKANNTSCADKREVQPLSGFIRIQNGNYLLPPTYPIYGTAQAAIDAVDYGGAKPPGYYTAQAVSAGAVALFPSGNVGLAHTTYEYRAYHNGSPDGGPGGGHGAAAVWYAPGKTMQQQTAGSSDGTSVTQPIVIADPTGGRYEKAERMDAYNKLIDVADFGVGAIESAYCEITGWSYTKADGTTGTIAAGTCTAPTIYPKDGGIRPGGLIPSVSEEDGSYCSKPFEPIVIDTDTIHWPSTEITIPEGSFLLQVGSAAPVYPTMEGALVYDLQLKKWGKMKLRYKQLLDYSPVNSTMNGVVPSNVFGIVAGALGSNGKITLFDAYPADSYISYGKVGYYRLGKTSPEEVLVQFRTPSTGTLVVETALDMRNLSAGLTASVDYTNATEARVTGAFPGRWCNIEIRGTYDISYIEYRGLTAGRR